MSETALPPPRPFHKFLPSKLYADNYIPVALQHRRHLSQIIYVTE